MQTRLFPAQRRGTSRADWLDSRHTFSFADWYDPSRMGYRGLRVINDDRLAPGGGFGAHPHRDMEIITYLIDGAVAHRDSLGTGAVVSAGEVQLMSAGSGIVHSEFNHSSAEPLRLLQIWLPPDRRGYEPRYEQREFPLEDREGTLRLLVSPDGADGSLSIRADARLYGTLLSPGETVSWQVADGRGSLVQLVSGRAEIAGYDLKEGDALSIEGPTELLLTAAERTEAVIFDLS